MQPFASVPTPSEVQATLTAPGVLALRGDALSSSFDAVLPAGNTSSGEAANMSLIVVATDLAGGQGVVVKELRVAPALDSRQAQNASIVAAAAAAQLEDAAAAAASSDPAAALLLAGATTSLLAELPAGSGSNATDGPGNDVRTQVLDLLAFLAANAEPTSANMQLLAEGASAALADPS